MKKTTRLIALALVALAIHGFVGASPATAGFLTSDTIDDVLSAYDKGSFLKKRELIKRIGNLGLGMEKVNRALESQGRRRLFCPPPEPALTNGHYFDIVKRKVGFHPKLGPLPENEAATVLMDALMEIYPCPE